MAENEFKLDILYSSGRSPQVLNKFSQNSCIFTLFYQQWCVCYL